MKTYKISKNEMRFLRRELINEFLHKGYIHFSQMKTQVRFSERTLYGKQLPAYK